MAIQPTRDTKPPDSQNEVAWIVDNIAILIRCWVVPAKGAALSTYTDRERASVRAVALTLIVTLAFVVRAATTKVPIDNQGGFFAVTAAAGGVAAGLAVVVDAVARAINSEHREWLILPAYAATLATMILYVFFMKWIGVNGPTWYTAIARNVGVDLAPVVLASLTTWLIWLAKASYVNRWKVEWVEAGQSLAIVAVSGAVVFAITQISEATFCSLFKCDDLASSSSAIPPGAPPVPPETR